LYLIQYWITKKAQYKKKLVTELLLYIFIADFIADGHNRMIGGGARRRQMVKKGKTK
jgi:hypothetical protein